MAKEEKEYAELSVIAQLEEEYPTIANGYKKIIREQYELFASKHLDYGMTNVAAGTQLANEEEKQFALTGLFFRLNDKVQRLRQLVVNGQPDTVGESSLDTFQDLSVYGIIAQIVSQKKFK